MNILNKTNNSVLPKGTGVSIGTTLPTIPAKKLHETNYEPR